VAIEVVEGNTGDPKTIPAQVAKLKDRFGLQSVVVVGDRGMVTQARIREDISTIGYDWISALVHKSIQPLLEAKVITPSLFDERGVAEISHPNYPGERLIACFNPIMAEDSARQREELLVLTEKGLQKVADACTRMRDPLQGTAAIGLKTGAVLGRFKMGKYFSIRVSDYSVSWHRKTENLAKDAAMDGIYVIRTSVAKEVLDAEQAVLTYKRLAKVERAFRTLKSVDLQVRPIYHRLEDRVRAHLFICMLAYYVEWHLRQAWAQLLYTDEEGSQRDTPVAPVRPSESGKLKKARAHGKDGLPLQSFGGLLKSLATLCLNRIRVGENGPLCTRTTRPTPLQARAFDLIGVTIT
jgi:transposase